ncbi:MAG: ArsR family transcriptional regulator [Dehalococcoidia bacterium]|nr:ArsR family transcriptional regulator [Dehalococcoidia bacterium]
MTQNPWLESFPSTRRQIIVILKKRGEASAADLAAMLFITVSAIRQHLGRLTGEGLVGYREVGHGPGRRRRLYSLSAGGEQLFPTGYEAVLVRLGEHLEEKAPGLLDHFVEEQRRRFVERAAPRMVGRPLAVQVGELIDLLAPMNFLPEVAEDGEATSLTFFHCPVYGLVRRFSGACAAEAAALADVLPTRAVERTAWRLEGAPVCSYRLAESAS